MDRTLYKELIILTQAYLKQEHPRTKNLFSDAQTIDHFRQEWKNIRKSPNKAKQVPELSAKKETKVSLPQTVKSKFPSNDKPISPVQPAIPPKVSKEEMMDFASSAGLKVKKIKETLILLTQGDTEEIDLFEKIATAIETKLGGKARVIKTLDSEKPHLLLSEKKPDNCNSEWICLLPYQEYQKSPQNKKALWNELASFYNK
ncbi:MAG: hypothetical protein WD595_05300 [Waddliaceae bacterium]